jgi:endoglucanase
MRASPAAPARIFHSEKVAQTVKSAVTQVAKLATAATVWTVCRFGNRRHSRFGNLRYSCSARSCRTRYEICGLAFLLLLSLAFGAQISAEGAGFLRTQGQDMVDESGRKVLLRGVGLGNWMLPEGYMWRFGKDADRPRKIEKAVSDLIGPGNAVRFWAEFRKQYITQADVRRIAELGFNSVRPALDARLFLTEGDQAAYLDEGFGLLDNLVRWCKQEGIYVIIDMHAAPGGQTGQNIDDSLNDTPGLFIDRRNQDRLVDLWVRIANRYKDEPTVAAYDLLNEPLPERTGAAAKYKRELEPLYRRTTKAIREIDTKHMITLEGADWANDWSVFSARFDDNMFYQFHYYCWSQPDTLNNIGRFLAWRDRLHAPIWAGETGEKDAVIYWGTTQYFEKENIGWSFWPWKKMDTRTTPYSITPPDGWGEITDFTKGNGKPSKETAQRALDQLLKNIRLENCVYYPDVVNALFRRVPGRVEAENYGPDGQNKSYFIADCSQKAGHYRTSEPVPIELIGTSGGRGHSEQAIKLKAAEWTAYAINSQSARSCSAVVNVRAENPPAVFQLSLNDSSQEVTITERGWTELKLGPVNFAAGTNRLKIQVKRGPIYFDWVDFR